MKHCDLMDYITLGKSDLMVSKMGMGVWQASGDWKGDDEQVIKAVETATELGLNLVDTAEGYGNGHSEEVLGRAVERVGREKIVIATKVYGSHLRYRELQKAATYSMKRLQVDHIDLYQVHWPDPWEQIPLKETMRALESLYLDGKIRAIGVSNFAVRDLEEARSYLSKTDIVSNQLRYNLLQRNIEEEVLPYMKREGITALAWSPLAQGALTGKYSSQNIPKGDVRVENVLFAPSNMRSIDQFVSVLSSIARMHMATVAQVALNWLASHASVIPIPGAKNAALSRENVGLWIFSCPLKS
ncbi:MAG: aldo/keto reductase [Thaumarchaeota archaeon]|nr:aldo/keto reductase [Nitrososphaerota archaeon]